MLERTASPLGLARLAVERVCNKEVKHAWKSQSVDWRHRHHQINHSFPFEDCGWHIFKPDFWVFGVWALSLLSSLSHLPFFFICTYCYAQIKIWLICRIQSLLTLGKELSLESVTFPGGLWWWFFRESDTTALSLRNKTQSSCNNRNVICVLPPFPNLAISDTRRVHIVLFSNCLFATFHSDGKATNKDSFVFFRIFDYGLRPIDIFSCVD